MGTTRRPFVWWTARGSGALLDELDPAVVDAVAVPQASADGAFVTAVRRRGFGLLLEGEAWRAQLDPAVRPSGFAQLPWVDPDAVHAPERWSPAFCEDFAEAYVEHQAEVATLLTTPGHVGGTAVRRRDVELAALCADHVRARALREPRPGDPHRVRRAVAATLVLRPGDERTPGLVDAYAELDVDAYVVHARGFTASEAEGHALFTLARTLRERSGREVLLAGLGELWQAALAADAAGVVADRPAGVYHGAILGCADGDVAQRRLFMRHPCPCGHHGAGAAPVQTLAHNVWWAMREARQAGRGDVGRAELLLAVRAASARRRRERLGIAPLPAGWGVLLGDVGEQHHADDVGEPS